MNLKEQLIELLKVNSKIYGAIGISKTSKTKYYQLRKDIITATPFLPDNSSIAERINYIINDVTSIKLCKCGCGQPVTKFKRDYLPGHGNKCEEVKQKKIQVNLEKYGVENPSQRKEVKEKKKQTMIDNYGSLYNAMEVMKENYKKTCIEKYGVNNVFKREDVKKNIRQKWEENKEQIIAKRKDTHYKNWIHSGRLTDKFEFLSKEYKGVNRHNVYKFRCLKCGNIFESNIDNGMDPRCLICNSFINSGGQSIQERELEIYLRSIGVNFRMHNRDIFKDFELDFYFPDKNFAIEYNGLYWHSQLNGKDRMYHLNKTLECEKKGIRLIQIFEDEWINKQKIVKARLKHILGQTDYNIYARKCEVREISAYDKDMFLTKYHIQGKDKSSVKLGLFYKNRIVSVMTFGRRRFDGKEGYELMRFCTIASFNIVGAGGKLLDYFQNNYNNLKLPIISYADRRWSNGNLYKQLGFNLVRSSSPNYFYLDKSCRVRYNRIKFQKHRLQKILNMYDESLSEWNNMKLNGYDRIWDCGNLVYEKI